MNLLICPTNLSIIIWIWLRLKIRYWWSFGLEYNRFFFLRHYIWIDNAKRSLFRNYLIFIFTINNKILHVVFVVLLGVIFRLKSKDGLTTLNRTHFIACFIIKNNKSFRMLSIFEQFIKKSFKNQYVFSKIISLGLSRLFSIII